MKTYPWGEERWPIDRFAAQGMSSALSGLDLLVAKTKLRLERVLDATNTNSKLNGARNRRPRCGHCRLHTRTTKGRSRARTCRKQHKKLRLSQLTAGPSKLNAKTSEQQPDAQPVRLKITYPKLVRTMWLRLAQKR